MHSPSAPPVPPRNATDHPTPAFDNLYIDFNGVVHTCTHGNSDAQQRTQAEMIMALFAAIETLFDAVRPQRLLFIAIDGVAPRAKMSQQRQRRFKAAAARADADSADKQIAAERLASSLSTADGTASATVQPGKPPVVSDAPFDSNCITPGTPFMEALDAYLVYFIQVR